MVPRAIPIVLLDPLLDNKSIMGVGGKLRNSHSIEKEKLSSDSDIFQKWQLNGVICMLDTEQ